MLLAAAALLAPGAQAQSSYPNPYTISTLAGKVGFVGGTTDGTGTSALFEEPAGESIDGNGNVYIADTASDTIRMITPSGTVTTIAGTPGVVGSSDGTGAAASFSIPSSVAVDGSGNIFVADLGNNIIRKIAPGGVVTTIAGNPSTCDQSPTFSDGSGTSATWKRIRRAFRRRTTSAVGDDVDGSTHASVVLTQVGHGVIRSDVAERIRETPAIRIQVADERSGRTVHGMLVRVVVDPRHVAAGRDGRVGGKGIAGDVDDDVLRSLRRRSRGSDRR